MKKWKKIEANLYQNMNIRCTNEPKRRASRGLLAFSSVEEAQAMAAKGWLEVDGNWVQAQVPGGLPPLPTPVPRPSDILGVLFIGSISFQ